MKLLAVSSWFPLPADNGSKLRAFHLLSWLAARYEVTLLSFAEQHDAVESTDLSQLCRRVRIVSGNPFKQREPLRARDLLSPIPRAYLQTYSPRMQEMVDEELPRHDVAIAFQLGAALYLAEAALPRIFEEAECGAMHQQFASRRQGPRRWRTQLTWWKYGRFLSRLIRRFDRTTVVSDVERELCASIGGDPAAIRVVTNGADRELFQRHGQPLAAQLVYPGSVTYSANLDAVRFFVREVLPLIRKGRPDVSLLVTGATDGIDLSDLRANPAVTFTGRVPDIAGVVAESAACVVPLRIGGGTRLKVLEAMAVGTPVVATDKGAEGLRVTDGRNILIADDPQAFAARVVRVLNDAAFRRRISTAGRRLIERLYTWDRAGEALGRVLQEAVDARLRANEHERQPAARRIPSAVWR
jgi:glycosyltransferase involved in cell wall biosynthesis